MMSFSQLPDVKIIFGGHLKTNFGPSYFVRALVYLQIFVVFSGNLKVMMVNSKSQCLPLKMSRLERVLLQCD